MNQVIWPLLYVLFLGVPIATTVYLAIHPRADQQQGAVPKVRTIAATPRRRSRWKLFSVCGGAGVLVLVVLAAVVNGGRTTTTSAALTPTPLHAVRQATPVPTGKPRLVAQRGGTGSAGISEKSRTGAPATVARAAGTWGRERVLTLATVAGLVGTGSSARVMAVATVAGLVSTSNNARVMAVALVAGSVGAAGPQSSGTAAPVPGLAGATRASSVVALARTAGSVGSVAQFETQAHNPDAR
jgi:hypothetical protein